MNETNWFWGQQGDSREPGASNSPCWLKFTVKIINRMMNPTLFFSSSLAAAVKGLLSIYYPAFFTYI